MSFKQKLEQAIESNNSLLCIGLDTDFEKLPHAVKKHHEPLSEFNKRIIDATHDLVCCYKLQIAYYASLGVPGLQALMQTIHYIHSNYPKIPLILDAKRGDIGDTSKKYAEEAFDVFEADAVTVNPYLGKDSVLPFLERRDKGIFVLCRTSNKGAEDFQSMETNGQPLYLSIAKMVSEWNKEFGNCMLVVGATWPEEMARIREVAPEMFFLVPGIGAQGGDLEKTLHAGLRKDKSGLIIHSARAILFASPGDNFAETARQKAEEMKNEINRHRA